MSDLIDRQAAIEAIRKDMFADKDLMSAIICDGIENVLKVLPSAQPKTFHIIDILTGKEADPYEIALNEDWAKNLVYCDMEGFAIEEDGSLILVDEFGRYEYCPIGRFEVVWDG